ncbi:alpha/beta fold hydrolase [Cryptosporangium phraense]|uniref:Alpha/beta fold hydrolase n=1 Tax=Cryptosporangium phraense TaxID=2593070 RepID=A0A545ATJ6_9ACTN|nr:alpha/beta fold hydrolase [Cryptosporangium phraense]TQS44660.1 alpha/beta fold hydrolase [Cryptosporangium phraense]
MSAYDRVPYLVVFPDTSPHRDTYGGPGGIVALESYLLRPPTPSDTVLIFMHPIGGGAYLPMVTALARAGHHVIYCGSRYRGVDSALIMENVVEDLGACVRDAHDRLGYVRIVLAGWSGGGALSLYYQQQANAGTGIPADAMLLLAAHVSRHGTLTEWLDASIRDETNPDDRDPALDLYGDTVTPPYSDEFLATYRAAQIARNRRITAWVHDQLRTHDERAFVVHGTMADPRWLDPAVDPNDRVPGRCYLGDPRVVNNGPVGLARFTTLRSWLSQWSYDEARGDGVRCAADVGVPTLVIGNSADDACTPSHTRRLYDAVGHPDKTLHTVPGATHYYAGPDQKPHLAEAVGTVNGWLAERGLS